MAHIHNEAGDHDHTVSFFIVRTDLGEPRVMLHRHKRIGKLMMFGGHIELNENPWEAVLREITEETGYDHSQLSILQPTTAGTTLSDTIVHPVPVCHSTGQYPGMVPHFHTDIAYALTAHSAPRGLPDTDESTEFHLLTADDLEELSPEEVVPMWQQLGLVILDGILPTWVPVPLYEFATGSAPHPA